MKKIKLITPLVVTSLVGSIAPIVGMTSCGGEKIVTPNDIRFDGGESEKTKTITDDAKVPQEYLFSLDRDIARGEKITCVAKNVHGFNKDHQALEDPVNVDITSISYPEKNKVKVVVTPSIEKEQGFAEEDDYVTFDLDFSCINGSIKVIDSKITGFKIIYDVNHDAVIPFKDLIIENGVLKGFAPSAYLSSYNILLIPHSVVEIPADIGKNIPDTVTSVLFEEGTSPLYIKQYGLSGNDHIKYLMLPNRLAYAENGAFRECHSIETLDLSTWSTSRTSPLADKYLFEEWKEKGEVKYSPGVAADIYFILREAGIPEGWLEKFNAPEVVADPQTNFLVASVEETNDLYICGVVNPTLFKGNVLTIPSDFTKIAPGAFNSIFNDWSYYGPINTIAFAENSNITRIYGDSFSHNAKIIKIDLSNCKLLETIDSGTFYGCSKGLKEIVLPPQIKTIGPSAFGDCKTLATINLDDTAVEVIQPGAFNNCEQLDLKLPTSISWIGASSFYNTGLTEINIPGRTKYIGYNAFGGCKKATKLNFTGSIVSGELTYLGDHAFDGCTVTNHVAIPASLMYIGEGAFANIPDIGGLEIVGEGNRARTNNGKYMSDSNIIMEVIRESIPGSEKYNFHAVTSAAVPSDEFHEYFDKKIISINPYAFAGTKLHPSPWLETNQNVKGGTLNLSIFENLSSIGTYAFKNTQLKKIGVESIDWDLDLPSSLRSIGDYAFTGSTIKEISNFDQITDNILVGKGVFSYCRSLKTALIPKNVVAIPNHAFEYCSNIEQIKIEVNPDEKHFVFGDYCFQFCSSVKVLDVSSFDEPPISAGRSSFYKFGASSGDDRIIYISNLEHKDSWKALFNEMGWDTTGWTYKIPENS